MCVCVFSSKYARARLCETEYVTRTHPGSQRLGPCAGSKRSRAEHTSQYLLTCARIRVREFMRTRARVCVCACVEDSTGDDDVCGRGERSACRRGVSVAWALESIEHELELSPRGGCWMGARRCGPWDGVSGDVSAGGDASRTSRSPGRRGLPASRHVTRQDTGDRRRSLSDPN